MMVAIIMLLGFCIVSIPSADAYDVNDGKTSSLFETSQPLSQEDVERLFDEQSRVDFAYSVIDCLQIHSDHFAIVDVTVSDMEIQKCISNKNEFSDVNSYLAYRYVMKISFTATATSEGNYLLYVSDGTLKMTKLFNNNHITVGDVLKIDAKLTEEVIIFEGAHYSKNSVEGLFVKQTNNILENRCYVDDATIKYTISGRSEETMTAESSFKLYSDHVRAYDSGEVKDEDIANGTPIFVRTIVNESYYKRAIKYDGKDDNSGNFAFTYKDNEPAYVNGSNYCSNAAIVEHDIYCSDIYYYGTSEMNSLFTDVGDPALEDNNSMRDFLRTKGSFSYYYPDGVSFIRDLEGNNGHDSFILVTGIIGTIALTILISAVYVMSNKKKKTQANDDSLKEED